MSILTESVENEVIDDSKPGLKILAIDPGGTTGYAVGFYKDSHLDLIVLEEKMSPGKFMYLLQSVHLHDPDPLHLIYEDFQYRNYARMGLDLTPVKLIGVMELFLEQTVSVTGYKQSPSSGKSFYQDDKLKMLGAYAVGRQHGRDATRHLLQWANFGMGGQWIAAVNDLDITLYMPQRDWREIEL